MKPVSTATVPPVARTTSWVWACPPRRSSASYRVTSALRWRTHAAVSPETPPPMTAMRRGEVSAIVRRVRCRRPFGLGEDVAEYLRDELRGEAPPRPALPEHEVPVA